MDKETLEQLLIEYVEGTLAERERIFIENELATNKDSYNLYVQLKEVMESLDVMLPVEPPSTLRSAFDDMLTQEMLSKNDKKIISFKPTLYRVAAAVTLLVVGGGIGFLISERHAQQTELEAMRKEMRSTKLMLMTMLKDQQSAGQRVQGANVAYRMNTTDDEITGALINALNTDTNTNVRLAALDALNKFYHQPNVRKALIESLAVQNDPMVQISLIRLLVTIKEKEVIKQLEHITTDTETLPAVKDEAHAGLLRLS